MRPPDSTERPALVLIVDSQEWSSRALDSCLAPAGYAVLRAYNGQQGLERAAAARPDIILVGTSLPDMTPAGLVTRLTADARIGASTPIVGTGYHPAGRRDRIEALEAGAWDYVLLPPDREELLAKMATWARVRRALERAREAGLVDHDTGVYNARGLLLRADELAAEAARYGKPLSCVVFTIGAGAGAPSPAVADSAVLGDELIALVRDALRDTVRTCDAIGRLTSDQFAVLAPSTDPGGAFRLAERVLASLDRKLSGAPAAQLDVHAGYCGVADYRAAGLDAAELIARAVIAMHRPHAESAHPRIVAYPNGSLAN